MSAANSVQGVDDSIADFLVNHREGPHVEHADSVPSFDFDVRQDAVYRCLCAFRKDEIVVDDETILPTLAMHKHLAAMNLKQARTDAVRRLRGRGSQRGRDERVFSLDGFDIASQSGSEGATEVDLATVCQETAQHFENIENDFGSTIQKVYDRATPTEQKAIRVLAEWQRRKDCGANTYPLRKTVHKLRAKLAAEGSEFDLSPRFL